jgi:hypothetical protein
MKSQAAWIILPLYWTKRTGMAETPPPETGVPVDAPLPTTFITITRRGPGGVTSLALVTSKIPNCKKPTIVTESFLQPGTAQGLNNGTVTTESLRLMLFCPRSSGSGLLSPPVIVIGEPGEHGPLLQNSSCPWVGPAILAWIRHRAAISFVMWSGVEPPLPACTLSTLNGGWEGKRVEDKGVEFAQAMVSGKSGADACRLPSTQERVPGPGHEALAAVIWMSTARNFMRGGVFGGPTEAGAVQFIVAEPSSLTSARSKTRGLTRELGCAIAPDASTK